MAIELALADGGKSVFADSGVSAAVVWFSDPVIEKGAANGAASANYGSLLLFDSSGKRHAYAANNPAYAVDGYTELAASNSPKDIYDAVTALTQFDEVLPTVDTTAFDADYPFRFVVNKDQTQGIYINYTVAQNVGGFRVYHYLDVMPKMRFLFFGGHGFTNTFDGDRTFYLALNEFNTVEGNLEGLC